MVETNVVQDLIHSRKRLPSIVEFHKSLRRLGMKMRSLIDNKYEVPEQFLVAAIVSYNEIENTSTDIIDKAEEILFDYEVRNEKVEIRDFKRSFDRLIFLFNLKKPFSTHGEARLFDHNGEIRQKRLSARILKDQERNHSLSFLEEMKQDFYRSFSKEEQYVILLFSHYIPCTEPNHNCSRLLYEFTTRQSEQLVISYFAVYRKTCPTRAWNYMRHSPYIYCIHPRDVQFGPKPFPKTQIEEEIEAQVEEDEYFRTIKTHFQRLNKRLSFKPKNFKFNEYSY